MSRPSRPLWPWVVATAATAAAAVLLWKGKAPQPPTPFRVVYVTAPSSGVADEMAAAIIETKLASCVNIIPAVTSHYMWEGKREKSNEALMVIKSSSTRLDALEKLVNKLHPYDVPEFLVLPVHGGSSEYLGFLADGMSMSL